MDEAQATGPNLSYYSARLVAMTTLKASAHSAWLYLKSHRGRYRGNSAPFIRLWKPHMVASHTSKSSIPPDLQQMDASTYDPKNGWGHDKELQSVLLTLASRASDYAA